MNKMIKIFIAGLLISTSGMAALKGQIQNENVKSLADIQSSVLTTTGNLSSGSPCIASPASVVGLAVGQFAYDTTTPSNIPAGTTISGLPGSCSSGQIKLSANAAGNGSGDTLTFGGQMSQLINDTKIYVSAGGLNEQLSTYIASVIGATPPTTQRFLSGSGTYTLPTSPSPKYLRVTLIGGGSGGQGEDGATHPGAAGANSTFGTSLLTAGGAPANSSSGPVAGGANTIAGGPVVIQNIAGGSGSSYTAITNAGGGQGCSSPLGGASGGAQTNQSALNAIANTGSGGGGGGGATGSSAGGNGGSCGGYIQAYITSPASTYAYSVGAGGLGGVSSQSGGNAGSGIIVVEEFY